MKWFLIVLSKYAVFSGRARRKEYWMFTLFYIIFNCIPLLLDYLIKGYFYIGSQKFGYTEILYQLVFLLPCLSVGVRRLHDLGKPGFLIIVSTTISLTYSYIVMPLTLPIQQDNLNISSIVIFAIFTLFFCIFGIWLLVLFCTNGNLGDNKYGPDPKQTKVQIA